MMTPPMTWKMPKPTATTTIHGLIDVDSLDRCVRASSRFATAATSFWNFVSGNFSRRHGTVFVRYQVPVLANDMCRLTAP
jgi:hypothetical protein